MEEEKKYEDIPRDEGDRLADELPPAPALEGEASTDEPECQEDMTTTNEGDAPVNPSAEATPPAAAPKADSAAADAGCLKQIEEKLERMAESEQRLFTEVREMHKLYHSEFAGRLKSMQDELEQYRKIDKGRAYDDILSSIARIYSNNETLADEIDDPRAKKSIRYLLLDLEELLGIYGMGRLRSNVGDKRNPRHCQLRSRIPTDDPEKHDTVAKSYNSGFYIGNRTVIKEAVDIYFYEGERDAAKASE